MTSRRVIRRLVTTDPKTYLPKATAKRVYAPPVTRRRARPEVHASLERFGMGRAFGSAGAEEGSAPETEPQAQVTTLSNGLRVISRETFGHLTTFGLLLDMGSLYETPRSAGAFHLYEMMGFASTRNFSTMDIATMAEDLGGMLHATSGRDQFGFCVDVLRSKVDPAMQILSDCVLQPLLDEQEIEQCKQVMALQAEDMPLEQHIVEAAHAASFGNEPLGRSSRAEPALIPDLSRSTLLDLRRSFMTADRMVLSAAGVDHTAFVDLAEKYLGGIPPAADAATAAQSAFSVVGGAEGAGAHASPAFGNGNAAGTNGNAGAAEENGNVAEGNANPMGEKAKAGQKANSNADAAGSVPSGPRDLFRPTSRFRSGEARFEVDHPMNDKGFVKVAVCVPVGGWHSPDALAVCVLQTLLGGGDSFSAGGPGKGMWSQLYLEILNRYTWAEGAEAQVHLYDDVGILTLVGTSAPKDATWITHALCDHLVSYAFRLVPDEVLSRAKNMLKCNLLTTLESRFVLFEDQARQVLTYEQHMTADEICAKIDAVKKEDIMRIVREALKDGPPAIASVGPNLKDVPTAATLATWFATPQ